jgi:hypothetical protein
MSAGGGLGPEQGHLQGERYRTPSEPTGGGQEFYSTTSIQEHDLQGWAPE